MEQYEGTQGLCRKNELHIALDIILLKDCLLQYRSCSWARKAQNNNHVVHSTYHL